ncbi:MAG: hypothetical protein HQL29_03960 [Candidatus Omnitrophica bacterium]|nr:hypothetical protein [Candidatus Omnitrophota bacterium]
MAVIEDTTLSASATSLKALSLTSDPAISAAVNIGGAFLVATGVIIVVVPLAIMGTRYFQKKFNKDKDASFTAAVASPNGRVIMSVLVAASLLISVGTAMLPRTTTVMVIHMTAGYLCLIISLIHVYQYRMVIKAQSKKYFTFLNKPKAENKIIAVKPAAA